VSPLQAPHGTDIRVFAQAVNVQTATFVVAEFEFDEEYGGHVT